MMKSIHLCLFIMLTLSSCGSNNQPQPPKGELLLDQPIAVSGLTRNYHLYLPANTKDAAIVVLLHGNSGSADQLLGLPNIKSPFKLWLDIAADENLVLIIPDGVVGPNEKQGWNDCRNDAPTNPAVDDTSFLSALLTFVQDTHSASTSEVFVSGISNGGFMTMRLANEIPDRLKAISIIVASRPVNTECPDPDKPMPVLIMNGTSDPIVPYNGGQIKGNRGDVTSTAETINYWINRNQTDTIPSAAVITDIDQNDKSTATRFSYLNGINGSVVEHYEITNGGHTEPSIAERFAIIYKLIVGNQNGDIEMAHEVWRFFSSL